MIRLNMHEAKTHLSKHLRRVKNGETIILCERNVPIAEISPIRGQIVGFGRSDSIKDVLPFPTTSTIHSRIGCSTRSKARIRDESAPFTIATVPDCVAARVAGECERDFYFAG